MVSKLPDTFLNLRPVKRKQVPNFVVQRLIKQRQHEEKKLQKKIAKLHNQFANKDWDSVSAREAASNLKILNYALQGIRVSFKISVPKILYKNTDGVFKLAPPLFLDGHYKLCFVGGRTKLSYVRDFVEHKTPDGGYTFIRSINGMVRVLPEVKGGHASTSGNAKYVLSAGEVKFLSGKLMSCSDRSGTYNDVHLHKQMGGYFPVNDLQRESQDYLVDKYARAKNNWQLVRAKLLPKKIIVTTPVKNNTKHRRGSRTLSDQAVSKMRQFTHAFQRHTQISRKFDIDGLEIEDVMSVLSSPLWKPMCRVNRPLDAASFMCRVARPILVR